MKNTLTEKILKAHFISGALVSGEELTIRIDQTLTQDSTGTMVYLELEAMNVGHVRTERSVAYIDHNTLQTGFMNADDHAFIESACKRHGIVFQKAGGGICHQLHLENYGVPGKTLLGSDSHTPTGGGIGMLAIGAGGMDVATAMALGEWTLTCPHVFGVKLSGALRAGVSAKDVILKVIKELTVKGGVGRVIEYFGEGVATLSASDRATITNMGAEVGATTSVFPSDERTLEYLESQGRAGDYTPLAAEGGAEYETVLEIDLSSLEPLAAKPHSPDNIATVSEIGNIKIDQVCIGSCTNSSYTDLMKTARILKGRRVAENVSLVISPGSAKILSRLAENGALKDMIDAGARIIENACGPCIGMGQSPKSGAVSLRTFNRNFKGRSGTQDAEIYLVSPETAAASAIAGEFRAADAGDIARIKNTGTRGGTPQRYNRRRGDLWSPATETTAPATNVNDAYVVNKTAAADPSVPVALGPNIKPFPVGKPLGEFTAEAALLLGDNITTDDIMPSDASLLPYRSNIPHLADFAFSKIDPDFPARAKAAGASAIIAGDNYGQGSSREHAALAPLYLGVRLVLASSFARIHRSNLINSGILPLTFKNPADANKISLGDKLRLSSLSVLSDLAASDLAASEKIIEIENLTNGVIIPATARFTEAEARILLSGGKIADIVRAGEYL